VSSQNSISRDRRDKIYGILGLGCDVGTGDIAVDYSISLFALYSNTMSIFTKELFESPSSTEAEECHEYGNFSHLIQNALLGPDLVVSGQAEMRSGRVKCDQASLPPFVLPVFAESEVVSVWGKGRNPPEYLRTPIEWFLETRSRSRNDCREAEAVANDVLIQEAWEADEHVLHSLLAGEEFCDRPGSFGLTFFETDRKRSGVGSKCIRSGDILWVFPSHSPLLAIIRECDGAFKIVGRACFFDSLGAYRKVDHIHQTEGSEHSINLNLSRAELQVLTCPLICKKARRSGSWKGSTIVY